MKCCFDGQHILLYQASFPLLSFLWVGRCWMSLVPFKGTFFPTGRVMPSLMCYRSFVPHKSIHHPIGSLGKDAEPRLSMWSLKYENFYMIQSGVWNELGLFNSFFYLAFGWCIEMSLTIGNEKPKKLIESVEWCGRLLSSLYLNNDEFLVINIRD
jgi:hypothetical protein